MDNTKKRSFETLELLDDNEVSICDRNERQKIGSEKTTEASLSSLNPSTYETSAISNDISSESDDKDAKATQRREANKLRARSIRSMKKKMLENTNKKLVLLTIENNKLRAENQMQRAELSLLRNESMQSTQQPLLGRNVGRPLPSPNISGAIPNIGNDAIALQNLFQALNSGNNAGLMNPNSNNAGLMNPNSNHPGLSAASYAPNDLSSVISRLSGDNIDLSRLNGSPNVQPVSNIAPELVSSSALQNTSLISGNVNNLQTIPTVTEKSPGLSRESQINELILSLLRNRAQP